mgnify:FL=1
MSAMRQRIVDLFGQHALKRSILSIREGGGVMEHFLSGKGVRTALEIGTYRGVGAAEISQFVDRVITIDLDHGRLEQLGESWNRQHFWSALGITNIDLRLVRDDAEKAALIRSLEFDFAFVDGAHDQRVRDDFELVRRCGKVLFHDVDRRGKPEKDYVYDFVMSLPRHELELRDIFALWTDSSKPPQP